MVLYSDPSCIIVHDFAVLGVQATITDADADTDSNTDDDGFILTDLFNYVDGFENISFFESPGELPWRANSPKNEAFKCAV